MSFDMQVIYYKVKQLKLDTRIQKQKKRGSVDKFLTI